MKQVMRGQPGGPLISIIIAVYNGAKTLQQCLDSVAQQSYPHVELIVIDGGSQDGTLELIKANRANFRYWVSEPDNGIYDAWNKALAQGTGEWVIFLGADDVLAAPHVLEHAIGRLQALPPDVLWAYGQVLFMGEGGGSQLLGEPWATVAEGFLSGMTVPHQAVFHRRELFEKIGQFDPCYRIAGDYAFLLKALRSGHVPVHFPLCVTHMGGGGISSRPATTLDSLLECARARQNLGVRPVFPLPWCFSVLKALVKIGLLRCMSQARLGSVINAYRKITGRPVL